MGGGGRRGGDKRKTNRNNNNNKNNNKNNQKKPNRSTSRNNPFVEGGLLSDWSRSNSFPSSFSGRGSNVEAKSGSRSANRSLIKPDSGSKSAHRKSGGNAFGYCYPPAEYQDGLPPELSAENNSSKNDLDKARPIISVDSKESKFLDDAPSSSDHNEESSYDYSSGFVMGDGAHRGLGFCNESNEDRCVMEEEDRESDLSSSDEKTPSDQDVDDTVAEEMAEETYAEALSPKKNMAFLSIGGMKLFTEDISDEESDDECDELKLDDEVSESSEEGEADSLSNSDSSDDTFDGDTDIDEEVAEDYMEGIGGSDEILDTKRVLRNGLDDSDGDTSSDSLEETLKKLGGIALQDASRDYGMKKPLTKKRDPVADEYVCSNALDDFMLVKDIRNLSGGKKKHFNHLPKSWPLEAQKSKRARNLPGAKKKHRKEMIAVKRRERMLRRGVDLEKVNATLERIVLDGMDMFSFNPMHSKDCSQVQRLAAIYRLRSWCQGSGKKRFVTVVRSQHTGLPSANDKLRLEKLIGAGMEDPDFAVTEASNRTSAREVGKKNGGRLSTPRAKGSSNGKSRQRERKGSYANQPVSFISSGVMESETVKIRTVDSNDKSETSEGKLVTATARFGAFEAHTRGFGSKMMAKMGFVEGAGLGKDGQGMAAPIEVTQRPKSLGLGVDMSSTGYDVVNDNKVASSGARKKQSPHNLGAFEKHTKGFGSKMMARMGFVEGMGLGRNSQGIVTPLTAVRRPKSRGLVPIFTIKESEQNKTVRFQQPCYFMWPVAPRPSNEIAAPQ